MNDLIYQISELITEDPDIFFESESVQGGNSFWEREVPKWQKITDTEVARRLITTKDGKKVMARVGVKIYMSNGGQWFVSRRYGSWTYHFPIRQKLNKFFEPVFDKNNQPVMSPKMKTRWDGDEFKREFAKRSPVWFQKLIEAYRDTRTWYEPEETFKNTDMGAADFTDMLDNRGHVTWKRGKRKRRDSDDDTDEYQDSSYDAGVDEMG